MWEIRSLWILLRKERKEEKKKNPNASVVAQVNEQNGFQAWLQCFQVNCLLSSTSLLTGWAQDKSQQAELVAACQMLLGLWLQALWIWLATLARSHLWLTQNFLFQTYFNNLMVEKWNQYMWHCFYLLRLTINTDSFSCEIATCSVLISVCVVFPFLELDIQRT